MLTSGEEVCMKINVFMDASFKDKIDWLSENYHKEIGGFILGEIKPEGIFMQDLIIPKQEVGTGSVDFDKKDLIEMREQNKEKCAKIIGEWHSHNSMGAFWSSTDDELIEQFCEGRDTSVFIVSSKRNHLIRFEMRKPIKLSLNKLSFAVINSAVQAEMEKEIAEKIKPDKPIAEWKGTSAKEFSQESLFDFPIIRSEQPGNIYGKNVVRVNKRVKVFGVEEPLRDALQDEYALYNPIMCGYMAGDLLFNFRHAKSAMKFFDEINKFIYEYRKDDEKTEEENDNDRFPTDEEIMEGYGLGENNGGTDGSLKD